MPEIKMPQLGESVVEGTITRWLKKEGDDVAEDELLVEISTDKVDSEVPSSLSGKLSKILVQGGDTVGVGTPIAVIGEDGAGAAEAAPAAPTEAAATDAGASASAGAPDTGAQPDAEQPAAEETTSEAEDRPAWNGEAPAAAAEPADTARRSDYQRNDFDPPAPRPSHASRSRSGDLSKRGIISPLVRRLADENDVDLDDIEGSGTGGRIRKQDVMRFIETRTSGTLTRPAASAEPTPSASAPERAAPAPEGAAARAGAAREELVPWSNIRRRTAEHMVASHLETARAWNAVEADWSEIVALRTRVKNSFARQEGFNLTYMPFLGRAVCETLLEMPEVNAAYDEENQANRLRRYVNLGIAVALEGGGLIVPVVKGADELNLVGLARAINDVASRARSKKLAPDDLAGGTFTITNPGPFGSIISVPIIPRGQTAILGFEAIQKRVVVTPDDAIAIRSMGFFSMSWDHRTIDGAEAAKFLARLRERIETTDFAPELAKYLGG
ncbi:MAG: dihydrolipoamide acetyltransferase family protein [Actinomycetota bacterium]